VHPAGAVTLDVPMPAPEVPIDPPPRLVGRGAEALLVAGTWAVGQLVFFRAQWGSGFNRVMGDPGAARFIIYINENWYQALRGHAQWRNPAFYYPLRNTLGRSDTLLLWQLVYAPARALGADPFLAYQLTLVALSVVGFVSLYALVRTLWRPPIALALLGAVLFSFSNALYVNANHPQLFGVLLVPAVCLLGVWSWRAGVAGRAWPAGLLGAATGALAVLVLYSTYYVAYFAALAALVAGVLALVVAPRATVASVRTLVRVGWASPVGAVVGAIGPGVLFAVTFVPGLHASGGYDVAAARFFAPRLADLVNVGSGNLVWGSSLVVHAVHGKAAADERAYAVTPILLLASLVAAVLATVREHRDPAPERGRRYSAAVLAGTGVVLLVLPMLVGGAFLWQAVSWIPGAEGIRAVDRIAIVAEGVLVLALVDAVARLLPWLRVRVPRPALVAGAAVLAALLCVEQVNVTDSSQMSRSAQVALLGAVPAPPPTCTSFYVETKTASAVHPARTQTTAMLLSARFGIPTLNGTSGSLPAGWHLFYPMRPGYFGHVAQWIAREHVGGEVCALDLDRNRWTVTTPVRS
jgi:hypothetical protein